MSEPLLEARRLAKRFGRDARRPAAVDGVDLTLRPGETLAVVGGSGAGKTTLARLLLRLIDPDAGSLSFEGEDFLALHGRALRSRRARIQMVFQDPLSALNPRATIGRLLADPLRIHDLAPRPKRREAVGRLLERVGLPASFAARYPHELSGGERQRVNIARSLATRPRLLILDEPVSALDVSIRAQILNLLHSIRSEEGLTYLLISHDLAVVRAVADRVAVMEGGRIVEEGPVEKVLAHPVAEATRALVAAVPRVVRPAEAAHAGGSR